MDGVDSEAVRMGKCERLAQLLLIQRWHRQSDRSRGEVIVVLFVTDPLRVAVRHCGANDVADVDFVVTRLCLEVAARLELNVSFDVVGSVLLPLPVSRSPAALRCCLVVVFLYPCARRVKPTHSGVEQVSRVGQLHTVSCVSCT